MASSSSHYTLPVSLVSKADLMHLIQEIGSLDDQCSQQEAQQRAQGSRTQVNVPISGRLRQITDDLDLNIATRSGRLNAKETIAGYLKEAPLFHISFASEPPVEQLQRVVEWLRQNIHGLAVVRTVIQPAIIAGCIVRSPNKVFDFTVREAFSAAAPKLLKEVRSL